LENWYQFPWLTIIYIIVHCPLLFKSTPFPLCRSSYTCLHTFYCHHISFPFFISHWETIVKSPIGTYLPIVSNNPQYGTHLIYLHIFFSHTLINWPSKDFPFIQLNILFDIVISLKLFSFRLLLYVFHFHPNMLTYFFTTTWSIFPFVFVISFHFVLHCL